jgi:ribonuclease P protein component
VNKIGSRLQASGFRKSQTSEKSSNSEGNPETETLKLEARSLKPASGFPKQRRLLRHADFEQVYKQGRRHFAAHMTVFYLRRDGDGSSGDKYKKEVPPGLRVGFTVGRVLGGSVQRNRMKRRLREAVRLSGFPPEVSADVVINPKRSLLAADFEEVRNQVARAFQVIEKAVEKITEKAVERTPEKTTEKAAKFV